MGIVTIGVDVGQKRDPTALCVAEPESRAVGERVETHFLIRHLERLPLGTRYPRVAQRVARIAGQVKARTGESPTIFVDATGVGQPVLDILRAEISGGRLVGVYFTYGDRRTETTVDRQRQVSLGKAFLVSRLQSLLQCARLHLPRTPEAEVLTDELLTYELRVDENANDRYGAFKVGTHDDLVTALGLAVQVDRPIRLTRVVWGTRSPSRRAGLR